MMQPPRLPDPPSDLLDRLQEHGRTFLLATHNRHKVEEFSAMLGTLGLQVLSLADLPGAPEPEETGRTFGDNALLKARDAAGRYGLASLADDSGLEVDLLNGMPGVRSARWAGPDHDDQQNLDLLLRQLQGVPEADRTARFVCTIALVLPAEGDRPASEHVVTGVWPGRLTTEPRGEHGFGYDPIFVPEGSNRTAAELGPEVKNAQSHRALALAQLGDLLVELFGQASTPKAR